MILTGARGGLGAYLLPRLQEFGSVALWVRNRVHAGETYEADLTSEAAIRQTLSEARPHVIVHTAALADVDRCQVDPQAAFKNNVFATRAIVDWVRQCSPSTRLVYISTDQVYGDRAGPHVESQTGPINIYGWTKLWAEDLVRTLDQFLVLRLNYVGRGTDSRPGLTKWLIDNFRSCNKFKIFSDVFFNPLSGLHAAEIISALIRNQTSGTFNVGATGGGISKAEFALQLAANLGLPTEHAREGEIADEKLKAPRPLDTRMDVSRLASIISLPDMKTVVDAVAAEFVI